MNRLQQLKELAQVDQYFQSRKHGSMQQPAPALLHTHEGLRLFHGHSSLVIAPICEAPVFKSISHGAPQA